MLISDDYRETLLRHRQVTEWGPGRPEHFELVDKHLIKPHRVRSIIDYGCGEGGLVRELDKQNFEVIGYDPGVPRFSNQPAKQAEGLVSFDVLEHIEPDYLGDVLEHIGDLFTVAAYLVIHLGPALHRLPDGRNAHLIQKPAEWWVDALNNCELEVAEVIGVSRSYLQVIVK
ncbi:MAG: methyltransferase domain-containing protein [Pseudomonadota bacterium]